MFQNQSGYKPADLVPTSSYLLWLFICCKTKLRKLCFFLKKYFVFFYKNIHYLQKKNVFIWKKKFYIEKCFYWKKHFLQRKIQMTIQKIYISFQKYIFTQNMFVLQVKYNLKYIFHYAKKILFNLKKMYIC